MEKVSYPTQAPMPHQPTTSTNPTHYSQSADIHVDVQAPPSYEQATGTGAPPITQQPMHPHPQPPYPATAQATADGYGATTQTTTQIGWANTGYNNYRPNVTAQQTTYTYHTNQQGPAAAPTILQPPPVVIIQPTHIVLGPEPVYITCPFCHIQKLTRIEHEPNTRTHLMALFLCFFGLWCCMCLPYCVGSCMSTNHYCGNCNKFIGTFGAGDL